MTGAVCKLYYWGAFCLEGDLGIPATKYRLDTSKICFSNLNGNWSEGGWVMVIMVMSQEMSLAPVDQETEEAEKIVTVWSDAWQSLFSMIVVINYRIIIFIFRCMKQLFLLLFLHHHHHLGLSPKYHHHHHGLSPKYHHEEEGGGKQEFCSLISSISSLRLRLHRKHVRILRKKRYSPKNI